jgi:hypothetical protein
MFFDDSEEIDDGYRYDEPEYMPEMDAFDRMGIPGDIIGIGGVDGMVTFRTPLEKLQVQVVSIARKLVFSDKISMPDDGINRLVSILSQIHKPEYIYPLGMVVGYYVSGPDGIVKKAVDKIFKNIKTLGEPISKADVIKYGKFVGNFKYKKV